jgi:site-specific DNA-cytosine methylase
VSAGEATKDLEDDPSRHGEAITGGKERQYWEITTPGNSLQEGCKKLTGKASWFNNVKLSSEKPACTLSSSFTNFTHWREPRRLTYREWKRLGSFPDDYKAKTDKIGKYMIGMSVPPRMMESVARQVIEQWIEKAR